MGRSQAERQMVLTHRCVGSSPAAPAKKTKAVNIVANEKNLVPFTSEQSHEEAVKNGRKGGKASAEARRNRKTLKEELLLMLEDEAVQQSVASALIAQARKGNVKAFETLRDTIGEAPVEKVQTTQTVVDMSKFTTEQIKAMLDDDIS